MITLYTYTTGNGRKVSILFEELGMRYRVHKVDLAAGEQLRPEFLEINPMGRIPAVVEEMPGGRTWRLFGSGAILLHFAHQTGQLIPADELRRTEALSWLMMGVSDLAPSSGYRRRFTVAKTGAIPEAAERCGEDVLRCLGALDRRLADAAYLAEEYSIADIACFPFVAMALTETPDLTEKYPALKRWHDVVAARPAVRRGMAIPE